MRKLTETGPSPKEKLILAGQQTQILPSVQRRRRRRRGWEPPLSLRKRRRIRKRKPLPKPLAKLFVILIFWFWLVIPLGPVPMIWINDHERLTLMLGILTQTLKTIFSSFGLIYWVEVTLQADSSLIHPSDKTHCRLTTKPQILTSLGQLMSPWKLLLSMITEMLLRGF